MTMARIPKKRKVADAKVDKNKVYSLKEASSIVNR
jgi:large subunit ribosomal protein L1